MSWQEAAERLQSLPGVGACLTLPQGLFIFGLEPGDVTILRHCRVPTGINLGLVPEIDGTSVDTQP